ncbi:PLP-dependent transferase [Cantharellus anzutake]|uniref:PLP-dependent transferase n=1 Tax=Cantharellus anzutake TaxID=1750568 RepID=UPI001903F1D6|nr:PLP-dependent transferase [Cantharellus anzutake]KAF8342280.1 PLP-dependent transferase [Cantharellus anzutake]
MASHGISLSALVSLLRKAATGSTSLDRLKNILSIYVAVVYSCRAYRHVLARGARESVNDVWLTLVRFFVSLAMRFPSVRKKIETEMGKARSEIEAKLVPSGPSVTRHLALPAVGRSLEWIVAEMNSMDEESVTKTDWKDGRVSGAVYHGGEDLEKVITTTMSKYIFSNPLHPDVFPAIRKMEAEVVSMCLRIYNNPNGAGTTTSGGTESILMSVKTHRDWARSVKRVTEPEMVVPSTAHAAFWKAAHFLGVKIHRIPVDPITRKVDLRRVHRAINSNTIMLVGSAVNFPDGNMDDIVALGALAKRGNVGLHVDCCLGSFIVPFLEEAGFQMDLFDFRVEGVTAISCDTHKYGFAPKGSSVIMYRNAELRRYQYSIMADWTGGVYGTPAIAGSRPGAILAGTWAAMQHVGQSGYLESCRSIVGCCKAIQQRIRDEIPELFIIGNPPASVFAFGSKVMNPLAVGDAMSKRGWHLNALGDGIGVHLACTRLTVPNQEQFIADLKDAVAEVKVSPAQGGTMVAVYGLGSSTVVGPNMVTELASSFLDVMYKA